jgi:hypothetical protein
MKKILSTLLATAALSVSAEEKNLASQPPPSFGELEFNNAELTKTTGRVPKLAYNNPSLLVDVGVGLWASPLPIDFNHDGLTDLVVVCTGLPSNGVYFFENSGLVDPATKLPIMRAAVRKGPAVLSPQVSYVDGKPVVSSPGFIYPDFLESGFAKPVALPTPEKVFDERAPIANPQWPDDIRANQWRFVDYDGDGKTDLIVGIDYWGDYNWENAYKGDKRAYDKDGKWQTGPLRGYVYYLRNTGTNEQPVYAKSVKLEAGGKIIDTFGMPSPCFADFRGTGKLDLICGEFRDGFTFFENIGTRTAPKYAAGRPLMVAGEPLHMDLCMITPLAYDFDGDGHVDLIVGDEDGRVALIRNTGRIVDGLPQFEQPHYFQQEAENVKFGAIASPTAVDLDGDGLEDLVAGNTSGYIGFIKNLGGKPPRWAAPMYISAGGKIIRPQAGPNGSPLGPSEAKWGYTNVNAADWDGDGLIDLVVSDIWGRIVWYKNTGTKTDFKFAAGQPVEVAWQGPAQKPAWNWWSPKGNELVTQWRSTPCLIDWNHDGLMDLITLDAEGYLAFFERHRTAEGKLELLPPQRIFYAKDVSSYNQHGIPTNAESGVLRMNSTIAGASGRRTFTFFDWDGDGTLDLLVNTRPNVNFFKGLGRDAQGHWVFKDMGALHPERLASHATTPTIVHWDNPRGDLLFGSEDGFLYFLHSPVVKP